MKQSIRKGAKLKIAAATFSIYAYEALKQERETVDSLEFIFTAPTFVPEEAINTLRKQQREFVSSRVEREKAIYGSAFEIHLNSKLSQRSVFVI